MVHGAGGGQEFVAGIRWRPRSRHREGVDTRITSNRDVGTTTAVYARMPGSPQLVDWRPGFPWPLRCECMRWTGLPTPDFFPRVGPPAVARLRRTPTWFHLRPLTNSQIHPTPRQERGGGGDAAAEFARNLELEPIRTDARIALAELWLDDDRASEAAGLAREGLTLSPDDPLLRCGGVRAWCQVRAQGRPLTWGSPGQPGVRARSYPGEEPTGSASATASRSIRRWAPRCSTAPVAPSTPAWSSGTTTRAFTPSRATPT